jgi:Exonuclease VII small subunit
MKEKAITFEQQLLKLEAIVEKIEQGGISLEESMALYEKGAAIEKELQKQLEDTKQRMTVLNNMREEPFSEEKE